VSTYTLPAITDDEGHSVTISYSLPSFITSSGSVLNFSPTAISLLTTTTSFGVSLIDSFGATKSYTMKITVPNRPPYFSDGSTSLGSVSVRLNSLFNFPIPAYTDPDLEIPVVSFS